MKVIVSSGETLQQLRMASKNATSHEDGFVYTVSYNNSVVVLRPSVRQKLAARKPNVFQNLRRADFGR
jgi:hypothetical protein